MPAYHMVCHLLFSWSVDEAVPGAQEPYTAVLAARPSISGGTRYGGRVRAISRKRSCRWEPRAFPRHPHPASSSLAFSSLTYKGAKWSFRIAVETWLAALGEAKPARVVMLHSERGAPTPGRAGLLGLLQVRL